MIDLLPNKTFFVQLALFLFSYLVLDFLVFRPVLRILQKRREMTIGYEEEASKLATQTEEMVQAFGKKMSEARQQGLGLKGQSQKEGEVKAGAILQEAREVVEGKLAAARQEIAKERKEAQFSLRKYARELAQQIAEKLLGRKVSWE